MFATTTIKVLRVKYGERDGFNDATDITSSYEEEIVDDILISPARTEDNLKDNPDGVVVDYIFHFPYWYTKSLRDCYIEFEDEQYVVIGDPRGYMPENTPGVWNRPVKAYLASDYQMKETG